MKRKLDISPLWPSEKKNRLTPFERAYLVAFATFALIILYCHLNPIKP
jgi:hypothetical protein